MSIRSLADFLEKLDSAKQLRRVSAEISSQEELGEITRRVALENGPALLFQKVTGAAMPLATNLLATQQRIAMALGAESIEAIAARLPCATSPAASGGWIDWLKAGFQAGVDSFAPRPVRTDACQQVVRLGRDVDLTELPSIKLSQHDTQPSLLGACVISGVEMGTWALGQFDLSILDRSRLAIRFGPRDPIARQFAASRTAGRKLPVAVIIGGPPALRIAAAAVPHEPALEPLLLAGLLGAEAIDVASCRTIALQVPAEAEMVIEGLVDPQAPLLRDVPSGTSGGFSLPPMPAYEIQVSALTQRPQPVFTAAIPHSPPSEATAVTRAVARLWLPAMRRLIPSLVDLDLPDTALAGQIAILAIRREFPGQATQAAAAWWGTSAGATTKMIVVVDAEVDVRDAATVWSEVAAHADLAHNVQFFDGSVDHRDFSTSPSSIGRRMVIDATTRLPAEGSAIPSPRNRLSDQAQLRVTELWKTLFAQ